MTLARTIRRVIRRPAAGSVEGRPAAVPTLQPAAPAIPAPAIPAGPTIEGGPSADAGAIEVAAGGTAGETPGTIDITENDPLLGLLQSSVGPVDLEGLSLDSAAVRDLRAAGIKLVVPLISQGELIGTLNLGPRLSEQDYSSDDRRLLESLAAQAAPALRVGQLVKEQEAEARDRQKMEQELQVAQLIQRNFLPRQLPQPEGWRIAAYYRPARAVGGDFYDCFALPDGRLAVVIGDVTDKGVPAALVMAATRSLIRASAQRLMEPGAVLERVNELLCPDMPEKMFVTCFYAALDPADGTLRFANAGHDLPYLRTGQGSAAELRARGMPLGLMPGMRYDEAELAVGPGQVAVLHSDGVAEAHAPDGTMFGFPRLRALVGRLRADEPVVEEVLDELARFTGPGWEQEDDITLVTVERTAETAKTALTASGPAAAPIVRTLLETTIPSQAGNERLTIAQVAEAVADLGLPAARLEDLKTAVGEGTMNAIEHGNGNDPSKPVHVRVSTDGSQLTVEIADVGGDRPVPDPDALPVPDLAAKLEGRQTPRGWGLFLIRSMVDEMAIRAVPGGHAVVMTMRLDGRSSDAQ
ncbi:MAG TPA: SpoIIE family protein phosphatase [Candidatus Limnocylindrales bacterium]|nr:SpoIIE family protein phosphatase [Candidatus Limnocylindrales bacterium]